MRDVDTPRAFSAVQTHGNLTVTNLDYRDSAAGLLILVF
jgi:hypothetical protein